jgi:hypothetical protein
MSGPGHKSLELAFVRKASLSIRGNGGTTEDGRHGNWDDKN